MNKNTQWCRRKDWCCISRLYLTNKALFNFLWSVTLFVFRVLPKLWGNVYGNGQHPRHPQQLSGSEDSLQSDPGSRKVSGSVWPFSLSGSALVCSSLPCFNGFDTLKGNTTQKWERCHSGVSFLLGWPAVCLYTSAAHTSGVRFPFVSVFV